MGPNVHKRSLVTTFRNDATKEEVMRQILTRTAHTGLLTDLYHPDSAYVSWRAGLNGLATFDLYCRRAPFDGAYLLVAGLALALQFLQDFAYEDDDIRYLASTRSYEPEFLAVLRRMRFTGNVEAMPEGTIAFPHEPLLRVSAPYQEALLVESGLLQAINLATLIATKAARITFAAGPKRVADFAFRRAQEPFTVTRSAYIGGCVSTSFLAAAYAYGLPATGTKPHALVKLFGSEEDAFSAVADSFERYTLLLDTYDARQAIHAAVRVAQRHQASQGHLLTAVRLYGGDLAGDSRYVRHVLDEAGLTDVDILVSGDMDEFSIADLERSQSPIDGYGVGTSLGVGLGSAERGIAGGTLGAVYKFVEYVDSAGNALPKIKVAGEKSTWPGTKQVYRVGVYESDSIELAADPVPDRGVPLLIPMFRDGRLLGDRSPSLNQIRDLASTNLQALPERYRRIENAQRYPVRFSKNLTDMRNRAIASHQAHGWF